MRSNSKQQIKWQMQLHCRIWRLILLSACLAAFASSAQNIPRPNIIGPAGLQVNSYTGNLFFQRTDFLIPNRGLPLELTFSYNSVDRNNNYGFGAGWSLNYTQSYATDTGVDLTNRTYNLINGSNTHAPIALSSFLDYPRKAIPVPRDSGGVTIVRADGRKDRFKKAGTGYSAPSGVFDQLSQYAPDRYQLTTKEGTRYIFGDSAYHYLTRIQDRNGNKIILSYTAGKLISITDSLGRTISLIWNGNHITEAIAAVPGASRSVRYEYNGSGFLTTVRKPQGVVISYTYGANQALSELKNGNGNTTAITYNSNNAVQLLRSCKRKKTIDYNPGGTTISSARPAALSVSSGIESNLAGGPLGGGTTHVTDRNESSQQHTSFEFDYKGRLVHKDGNCCGYNISYEYDDDNNISSIIDGNRQHTSFYYDRRGNLLLQQDPAGSKVSCTYTQAFCQIASLKDKAGNQTTFTYNNTGDLTGISDPLGQSESFTYDSSGSPLSHTDKKGYVTHFTYNQYGYPIRVVGHMADTTAFTYDDWGNLTGKADPLGHSTAYVYDSLNRLAFITDALSGITHNTYDANNNLVSQTNARGKTTTLSYNGEDELVSVTNALGKTTYMAYDDMGNMVIRTDPNGHSTTYEYDHLNRLKTERNAAGEPVSYDYDFSGNKVTVFLPNNNAIHYRYDALNRVTQVSDAQGVAATYIYDAVGNKLTEKDGNNNTITYRYDALNRPISATDALGNTANYTYDRNGNLTQETDRKGNTSSYAYDSLNRRKTFTDALSHSTQYVWDKAGNLISVTDANNHATHYTYDALDRWTQEQFADNTTKHYTYDAVGNLITRMDNAGQVTSYAYDAANQQLARAYSNSTDSFFYDDAGLMKQARNSAATVQFTYDVVNRISSETLNGKTTAYGYDIGRGTRTITYPGGRVVVRQFDQRYQLQQIRTGGGIMIAGFEYSPAGQLTKRTYANGATTNLAFNGNSQVTNLYHNPAHFADFKYSYDKEGNPSGNQFLHNTAYTEQYGYDNIGQLTAFSKGSTQQATYTYDAVGNRTIAQLGGVSATYGVTSMNAYSSIQNGSSTTTFTYDTNGNLTGDGSRTFTYDKENQLIAVNGGTTATYTYDAFGRRIQKTAGSNTTNYFFDGMQVIEERDDADSVQATYVWGLWLDDPVSMQRGGQSYYYHTNSLGSVVSLTNAAGAVVERYEYDAFGKLTIYDGNYGLRTASAIGNTYTYTGREYDPETGLYYYRSRYYDPSLGRFLQRDPLGYVDGMGAYAYVSNSPTIMIDPFGTEGYSLDCFLDDLQLALDVLGFVPGYGLAANLINASISAARGDYLSAVLGLVPGGRSAGKAVKEAEKAIVIGEGMNAVRKAAKELQSEGINAKWYQAWSKNFPTDRLITPSEFEAALARNQRWINSKVDQGYKIYDIGIDVTRSTRSPFYQLEQKILQQREYPVITIPR